MVRRPLSVAANTRLTDAIALMGSTRRYCGILPSFVRFSPVQQLHHLGASCLVVMAETAAESHVETLLGILTAADVVRAIVSDRALQSVTVAQVMSQPTLLLMQPASDPINAKAQLLSAALLSLRQHSTQYFPVLDVQGQLVGLVTPQTLRRALSPNEAALRSRQVQDIITTQSACFSETMPLLELAQYMVDKNVDCAIVTAHTSVVDSPVDTFPAETPIGIVTQQDIVQLQALGLNLTRVQAQAIVQPLSWWIDPTDSLFLADWHLQQQGSSHLVAYRPSHLPTQPGFFGIVTQANLLRHFELETLNHPIDSEPLQKQLEMQPTAYSPPNNPPIEAPQPEPIPWSRSLNPLQPGKVNPSPSTELPETRLPAAFKPRIQAQNGRMQHSENLVQQRTHLLSTVALKIRQSLDLQDILNTAIAEIRQCFQVDRAIVYYFEPDWSISVIAESVGDRKRSLLNKPRIVHRVGQEYWQNYQPGHIQIVEDIYAADLPPADIAFWDRLQVRANLAVPILARNQPLENLHKNLYLANQPRVETRLWGLLVAQHCISPRQWQPAEVDLLKQLATQIAIGIQQTDLYQQVQLLNTSLEHQVQKRTAQLQKALNFEAMLKRITDKVRDSLDASQILQTAVQELALVLEVSCCNAALYDLDQGTSTICYEYAASIPASQGRVAQMAHSPELYQQLLEGEYFQFCSILPNPVRGRVAMLACPILDDNGVLGDLWLVNQKHYAFSEIEIRLVQQVANQCAIAIRQAWLYQTAQAQVKELEKLNRLKDEFLSTVSHELRTPMSNIKMAIQMLKVASTLEKKQDYLAILETECCREIELINDLLDLQRLEASSYPISLETLILQDWIPNIVEPFRSRTQEHQQTLQVNYSENLPPMQADKTSLGRILVELLNNACKYTAVGGAIAVKVQQQDRPADQPEAIPFTIFTIRNSGQIPETELPHIFEKFYRVPNADPWKQGGTGLGLALIQRLVQQLGGTIQADSREGCTSFTVTLTSVCRCSCTS